MNQQSSQLLSWRRPSLALRKQRGMATLLIILLIGIGLIAISVGTLHSIRSTQERQLASHAQVNAQAGAWATAEAVRTYLAPLDGTALQALNNSNLTLSGDFSGFVPTVKIKTVEHDAVNNKYLVGALITSAVAGEIAGEKLASSTLEVVYEVAPAVAPQQYNLASVLDFYNTLEVKGGITLDVPEGSNFNVDGDFISKTVGIGGVGLNRIAVTGDIDLGGPVNANEVIGRNVTLSGASGVKRVYAFGNPDAATKAAGGWGDVTMSGGTAIDEIQANGSVLLEGSSVDMVSARRDVTINRGGSKYGEIIAGRDILALVGTEITRAARAVRNVEFQHPVSGNPSFVGAQNGNITCDAAHTWHKYTSTVMQAGGQINNCAVEPVSNIRSGNSPTVSSLLAEPVAAVTLTRPKVDAWPLRTAANYAIEYTDAGVITVTVRNINGVENGTYVLAKRAGTTSGREYLCNTSSLINDECTDQNAKPFCAGAGAWNSCFSVKNISGNSTLSFNGSMMPPGVVWVKGSLWLQNGTFFNTFVVTNRLQGESSNIITYAVNFAAAHQDPQYIEQGLDNKTYSTPKDAICKNEFYLKYPNGLEKDFVGMYPTNYCKDGAFVADPPALGNIAMLAGGYDPALNTDPNKVVYTGGTIDLKGTSYVHGTVVAGDLLNTDGNTKIFGYISAAGLSFEDSLTAGNSLGGSTTLSLDPNYLPPTYKPHDIPDLDGGGAGQSAEAKIFWSRYL